MPPGFWHYLNRSDISEFKEFLKKWEYRNVNLSRYFFSGKGNIFKLLNPRTLYLYKPAGRIEAVLLKGPYGLFLPIFSETLDFTDCDFPVLAGDFRTLMGTGNVIRASELWFPSRVRTTVNYRLMSLEREKDVPSPEPSGELTIRKAGPGDAKELFPLQQAYELEEVILDPSTFNPLLCMENLKKHLKNEVIYIAERNGTPVAKAGTNARGLYYAQLGGIFTLPSLRNRGISRILVSRLIYELDKMKMTTCLFAKPDNLSALSVYKRCGLKDMGDFRISYLYR